MAATAAVVAVSSHQTIEPSMSWLVLRAEPLARQVGTQAAFSQAVPFCSCPFNADLPNETAGGLTAFSTVEGSAFSRLNHHVSRWPRALLWLGCLSH